MPTLDLRHSPWIPLRERDGTIREVGLRDVLVNAHEYREIRDPMPIVEFGLYRLLVALVMDIWKFRNILELKNLLKAGKFDVPKVEAYFAENADCFDLFSKERPFLQFSEMGGEADKPLAGMLPLIPSGTNANHFHHAREKTFGVCPEAAARLLTTLAPFMTAGGAGLAPSINGAPPWYVLLNGDSLFQTLCLNCYVLAQQDEADVPAWRRTGPFNRERRVSASLLEGLTWQPRQILLVAGEAGCCSLTGQECSDRVSRMKFGPGASTGFVWTDPNVAYRLDEKGPLVVRPQEDKQVWRDVGPLALLRDETLGKEETRRAYHRPRLIDQYANLRSENKESNLVPNDLRLTVYGMRTDLKMKVFEWQRESLEPLPAQLVLYTFFATTAQNEVERAGRVDSALASALKRAYPREGKGNKKAFGSRIAYARRAFWNALRLDYLALLSEMATCEPQKLDIETKPLLEKWKDRLKAVGEQTLDTALQDLYRQGLMLVRLEVSVRSKFAFDLRVALERQAAKGTEGKGKKPGRAKTEETAPSAQGKGVTV